MPVQCIHKHIMGICAHKRAHSYMYYVHNVQRTCIHPYTPVLIDNRKYYMMIGYRYFYLSKLIEFVFYLHSMHYMFAKWIKTNGPENERQTDRNVELNKRLVETNEREKMKVKCAAPMCALQHHNLFRVFVVVGLTEVRGFGEKTPFHIRFLSHFNDFMLHFSDLLEKKLMLFAFK